MLLKTDNIKITIYMQVILGGGGAIGGHLAHYLSGYTNKVRIVSRHPKKVNDTDELMSADLTTREDVFNAVKGAEITYITIGFEYNIKVWREKWPDFIKNAIDACKFHKSKLVFFDNIYMYDRNHLSNMTEKTPVLPSSKKGKVRAQIAKMITDEFNKGELTALIARSADFYGPVNNTSVLVTTVFRNLNKGKAALWFAKTDKIHNYTYTPDAAQATAMLGNTPDTYHQVWHLPASKIKLTGKQWIELIAKELNTKPKYNVLPAWFIGLMGFFMPIMKELKEMIYQYDRDYYFNCSKFEKRFDFKPKDHIEAIKAIVNEL